MCHLITYRNPAQTSALNILQTKIVEDGPEAAREEAECLLHAGSLEVQVWELLGSPVLVPTVEWK